MARAHLIFGILLFVVFLTTGQFMEASFPDKENISQEFRLLMRSRHIYILLSSFGHIFLGLYMQISPPGWRKYLQLSGSAFLTLGSVLLIGAFFYETYATKYFSEMSSAGLYASLAGTLFHLSSRFALKSNNE